MNMTFVERMIFGPAVHYTVHGTDGKGNRMPDHVCLTRLDGDYVGTMEYKDGSSFELPGSMAKQLFEHLETLHAV